VRETCFIQFVLENTDVANSASSKKRVRQNTARRAINVSRKSAIKTQVRKFEDAIRLNDLATAETEYRKVTKILDQASAASTMHKNTAARKKSRLARKLNDARTPS
jgi:small subunit ribosomal protein S20